MPLPFGLVLKINDDVKPVLFKSLAVSQISFIPSFLNPLMASEAIVSPRQTLKSKTDTQILVHPHSRRDLMLRTSDQQKATYTKFDGHLATGLPCCAEG